MKAELPDIAKLAERLLCDIEQAVKAFPRYHKYSLGSELREQAMLVTRLCHRAWRDRSKQAQWVSELVWAIDEMKISLQLGSMIRAFKSFAQFEQLIRATEELGKRAGGWKKSLHQKGQNPGQDNAPERAQILSGHAASADAGANP
ncbi:MAG: four helix bundle protein [Pseudomonadota bacterium]